MVCVCDTWMDVSGTRRLRSWCRRRTRGGCRRRTASWMTSPWLSWLSRTSHSRRSRRKRGCSAEKSPVRCALLDGPKVVRPRRCAGKRHLWKQNRAGRTYALFFIYFLPAQGVADMLCSVKPSYLKKNLAFLSFPPPSIAEFTMNHRALLYTHQILLLRVPSGCFFTTRVPDLPPAVPPE